MKPRGAAINQLPGLPAFLLMKLLRFADYSNDDKMIKGLLYEIIQATKDQQKVNKLRFMKSN